MLFENPLNVKNDDLNPNGNGQTRDTSEFPGVSYSERRPRFYRRISNRGPGDLLIISGGARGSPTRNATDNQNIILFTRVLGFKYFFVHNSILSESEIITNERRGGVCRRIARKKCIDYYITRNGVCVELFRGRAASYIIMWSAPGISTPTYSVIYVPHYFPYDNLGGDILLLVFA